MLAIRLPSGRRLYYIKPRIETSKNGYEQITFEGDAHVWTRQETYGAKIVENCLSASTEVLTKRGWIPILHVTDEDQLWDGDSWVNHDGLVCKGTQTTILVGGVYMTPDHKVLLRKGWTNASSCEGLNWRAFKSPYSPWIRWLKQEKIVLVSAMRLRQNCNSSIKGVLQKTKLWLHDKCTDCNSQPQTRILQAPSVCSLAFNEGSLQFAFTSRMEELWRQRNIGLSKMGRKLRTLLERYGRIVSTWLNNRSHRQQWELRAEQLQMDNNENANAEQKGQQTDRHTMGQYNSIGSFRKLRNWGNNTPVSVGTQLPKQQAVHKTQFYEPVYDIINAGLHHRFTVRGQTGKPIIVHNCIQAIARDVLFDAMRRLEGAGLEIVLHCHDEILAETSPGVSVESVCELMTRPPVWAKDLYLRAEGWEGYYYKKG
jgi:hypothetical protein